MPERKEKEVVEQRVNPESLDEIKSLKITDELRDFVNDLAREVLEEKTDRATWENSVDKYVDLRYGIRAVKTNPWPKCANYSLPLVDQHINSIKPFYINLVNITPVVVFEPFGSEDIDPARKREVLFEWRLRNQVKFYGTYCNAVDKLLEQGAVVLKVIWKYKTNNYTEYLDLNDLSEEVLSALFDTRMTDDVIAKIIEEELDIDMDFEENVKAIDKAVKEFREGKTEFELSLMEVIEDRPQVILRDLRTDIVIPQDTVVDEDNIDGARWVDDKIWLTKNELKIAMKDGKYEEYPDSDIDSWTGKTESTEEGSEDLILIHEVCCWRDTNDDDIEERCIIAYPDADPSAVLRFIELPYDHNQWPYTLIKRELNDMGVYSSRGVGALDEDYQNGISTAFNQSVDNGTIVNSPVVVTKRNTITNIRNRRYIPGEYIETNGPTSDYEIRQLVNMSQGALFQQAQYLKSWADQRIGSIMSGLTAPNNLQGQGQQGQKTAREVNLIEGMQGGIQSMDLQVFQYQMARVYSQIDALYDQFQSEDEYELIMNEKPMKVSRKQIQGKFNVVPNGRLDNTNPTLRAQKLLNLYQLFAQDPDIKQYELKKMILQDYDYKVSSRILYTEEEKKQMAQQAHQQQMEMMGMQEQMQQKAKGEAIQTQLALRKANDIMDVQKEAALTPIQGRKYAPDSERERAENED